MENGLQDRSPRRIRLTPRRVDCSKVMQRGHNHDAPRADPLNLVEDGAVHSCQQQEADVRNEQESEEQPDVMERAPGK